MEGMGRQRPGYEDDASLGKALENATERDERRWRELEALATMDSLTSLPNRRVFEERLDSMLGRLREERERSEDKVIAILTFDIDHFKSVNDTYGHPAGDEVLKTFASVLRRHIRGTDLVARLGGEEFAIAIETEKGKGYERAEEIRGAIQSNVRLPDGTSVTVSIGVAETMGYRGRPRLALRADQALYEAKEGGRNRTKIAGPLEE